MNEEQQMLGPDIEETPPEPETLVNLVDKIPVDKQEEIVNAVCDEYDIDIESRSDWEEKRNRWYKLWACIRDTKTDPWPGCSNICIPMLATASNQFHARAYQSIFAAPGVVKCMPVGANDVKRAKNVENFMNWQIMYEMEEYEEIFDKLLQLLPINGTHFKKNYYSKALERPVSEHVGAMDFVLPYRTKSLEEARRTTHRMWLHYDQMEERYEEGLYHKNFEKIDKVGGSTENNDSLTSTADAATGQEQPIKEDNPRLVLESHRKYKLDGNRKPYIFTVDYDSRVLLRAVSREFDTGSEKKTLNYFTDYHFLPNPDGFYSFGFGHFLEPLNEMANTAFNQIFDGGSISNTPFGFYGRRAGVKKKQIKLQAGKMYEVDDAKQIYFPSLQRIDQTLFMTLGLIQQYAEQFTSTSDYLTGRESKGTKTPTAHGTLAIIEQGLVTFAVMTKRIFRSMRKELRLLMALNQLYLPDSKEYRVMGSEDAIAFPEIKREEFDSVKDVIPIGDPSYASKQLRRQEAIELYQVGMQNPYIVGNPQAGMQPQPKIIHELWSDLVDAYDKKNKAKLVPEMPEEPISPEEENAMMMQGDYSEPKPGEDHKHHMQIHRNFENSPYWAAMSEEGKKLHEKHGKATLSQMMKDEAQMQALGSQPQGPATPQQGPQIQKPQGAINPARMPDGGTIGL